jgi:hypothetical protein
VVDSVSIDMYAIFMTNYFFITSHVPVDTLDDDDFMNFKISWYNILEMVFIEARCVCVRSLRKGIRL